MQGLSRNVMIYYREPVVDQPGLLYANVTDDQMRLLATRDTPSAPAPLLMTVAAQTSPGGDMAPHTIDVALVTDVLPWDAPADCPIRRLQQREA